MRRLALSTASAEILIGIRAMAGNASPSQNDASSSQRELIPFT
jgi:hypothetical protein